MCIQKKKNENDKNETLKYTTEIKYYVFSKNVLINFIMH